MQTGMRIFSGLTLFLLCASIHGEEVTSFEDAPTMVLVQEGSEPVTHKTKGVKASKALPKAVHAGEHKAADNSLYEMQSQLFSQNLDEDLREFNILPKGKSLYQKQTELYNKMLSRHTSEVTVLTQLKDSAMNSVLTLPKSQDEGKKQLHDVATYDYLTGQSVPNFVFDGGILMQQESQPQGDSGAGFGNNPDPAFDGPNNGHEPTGKGADCDPVTMSNCEDLAQTSKAETNPDGDFDFKGKDEAMKGPDGKTVPDVAFKPDKVLDSDDHKDKKDEKDEKDCKKDDKDCKKDDKDEEDKKDEKKTTAEVDFVETNMFNF